MKRILCIIANMNAGGAETFLMKLYRTIDKEKYQMDFCVNVKEKCFYEDEILSMGGNIYRIPSKSENTKEFKKQLTDIVSQNNYKYVLRITSNTMGFMDLKIAKKAGAEICSARSSNSGDGGGIKVFAAHILGRILYTKYVDVKIAPSDLAAKYTFGKKAYENGEVNILHNAIDTSIFRYSGDGHDRIRKEFNISESTKVFGHVGRFMPQKNHMFLLEIFSYIKKGLPDSVLLLVGKGELEEQIRQKAKEIGIEDSVVFAGVRSDIPDILSAMDVFVFPSLYEGMPNTVIEAQSTGLPCMVADTITKEADITGLVKYLPLGDVKRWADVCVEECKKERIIDVKQAFTDNGYNIESATEQFVKLVFGE